MSESVTITKEIHQTLAVQIFNSVWELIEKNRSAEDDVRMINAAHATLHHWRHVGTPLNVQRGEWLISRVYSILNMPAAARFHADNCLALTEEHGFGGFDRAFAYESVARAGACAGDRERCESFYRKAREAAEDIEKKDDRDYFLSDLAGGEWFGLRP